MIDTPGSLLLTPHGDLVEIQLPADSDKRLTVMYAVLRCRFVDVVALTTRLDMWIDDEGMYTHVDDVNVPATLLARRHGFTHQPYYGPVLLTGGVDDEGDTVPVTRDGTHALLTALRDTTE
ncbi:DUF3846 domain-containing protein [Streptomyces sp. SB3404]|uniref:DUF3846 domain-containing protein n=2 Tax=Streptomyces boncukensis TaxID=2711219 RepID=A0A6G4WUK4_9ACTN|nr:DUF3846 domain-containing protein [Streptomyces boncukensis]